MGVAMAGLAAACVGVGLAAGPLARRDRAASRAAVARRRRPARRPAALSVLPRRRARSTRRCRSPALLVGVAGVTWLVGARGGRASGTDLDAAASRPRRRSSTPRPASRSSSGSTTGRSSARRARSRRAPPGHAVPAPVHYRGEVSHVLDERLYAPLHGPRSSAAPARPAPADGEPPALPRLHGRRRWSSCSSWPADARSETLAPFVLGADPGRPDARLVAPLLLGITKRVKARLQYRRGPSVLQPYRDLAKWWGKESVESDAASPLTAAAPAIVLAAIVRRHAARPARRRRAAARRLGRRAGRRSGCWRWAVRAGAGGARCRQRVRRHGQQPRGRDRDPRRAGAAARPRGGARWRPARPTSARSRRSARVGGRHRLVHAGAPPGRRRVRRSSPSPRRATSRSTTPTRTSS